MQDLGFELGSTKPVPENLLGDQNDSLQELIFQFLNKISMYIMVRLNGRLGGRGGTGQGEVRAAHSFAWEDEAQSHVVAMLQGGVNPNIRFTFILRGGFNPDIHFCRGP